MSLSKNVSEFRRRRKNNLINVLGGRCQICGFNLFPSALEFHHEDPTQKEFGIAQNGTCHDIETDLNEAKKCFLLCANCHRGVHSGYYPNPTEHIFDETLAQQLISERNELQIKHPNHCIDCGCEIDRNATRCAQCAALNRRICTRPTRDELKALIRHQPFVAIGLKYGVTDNAIRKWCKNMSLPYTKTAINAYSDEEWQLI